MSDRDYVIQIEGQSSSNGKFFEAAGGVLLSSSRRTSISSQQSLPSCTSPNYDSGNFSCSNTSEIYVQPIEDSSDDISDCLPDLNLSELTDDVRQLQKDLREKDQMLLLALADARKLRSELERSIKSERWYKNELRNQKRSRLEMLEKLYLNERRFVEENQKLKQDCTNLYSVCSEIERKALSEKDSLVKQLQELQRLFESTKTGDGACSSQSVIDQLKFELQKQREVVLDKESLIEVLKKQKQSLLKDLDNLTIQRDSKILHLEANSFTLDQENRKITRKCVALVEEKTNLEEELRRQEKLLEDTKCILQQREVDIAQLKENQQDQLKKLQMRASEIEVLKNFISQLEDENLREGSNNYENLSLLETYKKELESKSAELDQLKLLRKVDNDKISKLQVELLSLENLQESYDETRREIDQLKFQLKSKECEAEHLRILQTNQTTQIADLQAKLVEYQKLRDNFDKYVSLLQANNHMLDARENEIKVLKLKNESLHKDLNYLKDINCEREKLIDEKEGVINARQKELKELQSKFEEQSQTIAVLNIKLRENDAIRKDLADCQSLLQTNTTTIAIKEKEIIDLKQFVEDQSKQLLQLDIMVQENSKLNKEIDNINRELAHSTEELKKMKDINSNQIAEIQNLDKCKNQIKHLEGLLKEKISDLQNKDLEIETLKLVLRGQKAQIKRFNCKCAENEELREKIEEAANLLMIDNTIFETETAELEYLRKVAERQALEIYKLTEKSEDGVAIHGNKNVMNEFCGNDLNERILDLEKYFECNDVYGTQDFEAMAHRIEMMKMLVDKKSDKILQLNCETEKWIELLKNLRTSRSRSRESCSDGRPKFEYSSPEIDIQETMKRTPVKINTRNNDKETVEILNQKIEKEHMLKDYPKISNKIDVSRTIDNDTDFETDHSQMVLISSADLNILEQNKDKKQAAAIQILHSLSEADRGNFGISQELCAESESIQQEKLSLLQNYNNEIYQNNVVIHPPIQSMQGSFITDDVQSEKILRKTSLKVPDNDDSNISNEDNDWKLLKKVLETEHRKKIARYEVHMRTLLDNIKSYKRKFELMEDKYNSLCEKYRILEEELKEVESEKEMIKVSYETEMENIMTSKIKEIQEQERNKKSQQSLPNTQQLHKVSKKYEKSQKIIAVLKHQLETARKQFLEMEDYKRLSVELKLNLDNFVGDYAKLRTPLDTYKTSIATDEIYDLIARSNNLVPNFDNLSNSIDDLKSDIKNFSSCVIGGFNPIRKMSLMDELKAADLSRF